MKPNVYQKLSTMQTATSTEPTSTGSSGLCGLNIFGLVQYKPLNDMASTIIVLLVLGFIYLHRTFHFFPDGN